MTTQATAQRLRKIIQVVISVVAAAFLFKQLALMASVSLSAAETGFVVVGALTKLGALTIAAFSAGRVAEGFGRENSIHTAWLLLTLGLGALATGQAVLTLYQVLLRVPSPFPSVADVAFLLAYPLMIAALVAFLRAYSAAGFPTEGQRTLAVTAGVCAFLVAVPLLIPIARSGGNPLATTLNLLYPALDLALSIPAVMLVRAAIRFRGGAVSKIWAWLLAGILFSAAGDILFAWFTTLGQTHLDALIDLVFVIAYGALAVGVLHQKELLEA